MSFITTDMDNKKSHITLWRNLTQGLFVFLLNPYFFSFRQICFPVLNCWGCPIAAFSCPIGAMGQFFAAGVFPFLVLGTIIFFGGLMGRMLCGWVCPFGFLQDLLYKIHSSKIKLPPFLKYGKYATLLIMVLFIPIFFGITVTPGKTTIQRFFFCNLCPAGTLEATLPAVLIPPSATPVTTPPEAGPIPADTLKETIVPTETNATTATNTAQTFPSRDPVKGTANFAVSASENVVLGLLQSPRIWIFIVFLIAFILISRPFCRSACPIGAMFAILNKISFHKLRINKDKCLQYLWLECKLCEKACPTGHKVFNNPNSPECIRCLECQKKCPTGAIENQYF